MTEMCEIFCFPNVFQLKEYKMFVLHIIFMTFDSNVRSDNGLTQFICNDLIIVWTIIIMN